MNTASSAPTEVSYAEWIHAFFAAIDGMDPAAFAEYFEAESGCFRFANHPPLMGRDAIAQGCAGIFSLLDNIRHEVLKHWAADGDVIVEGQVHYVRQDGLRLSVPFLSVFEFADAGPGSIQSYRVFVDSHELFLPSDKQ
ncbi:MAG: nuclear transport factor 2 family protein [Wenzhouxiangella sp.]